jgi:hypothetical protein
MQWDVRGRNFSPTLVSVETIHQYAIDKILNQYNQNNQYNDDYEDDFEDNIKVKGKSRKIESPLLNRNMSKKYMVTLKK